MDFVGTSQPLEDEDLNSFLTGELGAETHSLTSQDPSWYTISTAGVTATDTLGEGSILSSSDDGKRDCDEIGAEVSSHPTYPPSHDDENQDDDDPELVAYRAARREERARLVRRVPPLQDLPCTPAPSHSRTRSLVRRVTKAADIARRKERARTQAHRIARKLQALADEAARLRRKHRALYTFITDSPRRTVSLPRRVSRSPKNKENLLLGLLYKQKAWPSE